MTRLLELLINYSRGHRHVTMMLVLVDAPPRHLKSAFLWSIKHTVSLPAWQYFLMGLNGDDVTFDDKCRQIYHPVSITLWASQVSFL